MSFKVVPKSVTLNDLERRNGPYLRYFTMYDVLVKKFTFAISSPDEFLVGLPQRYCGNAASEHESESKGHHHTDF